jgi:6-phosphogluconate dehydrogenase
MHLGMIGLGRMGASLVLRLTKDGHNCVIYDVNPAAVKKIVGRDIQAAASIDELVAKLAKQSRSWPRAWMPVTSSSTAATATTATTS